MNETAARRGEKLRLTAESAADAAVMTASAVCREGGRLADRARRELRLLDLRSETDLCLRDIGRMIYLAHTGAETDEAALTEKLRAVDALYAETARLRSLRGEPQARLCPACGRTFAPGDRFCSVCGTRLK